MPTGHDQDAPRGGHGHGGRSHDAPRSGGQPHDGLSYDAPALPEHLADSAGQPWLGRQFAPTSAYADDDGSAPARLVESVRRFRAGDVGAPDVVDVFRRSRLLIPLVAEAGTIGVTASGRRIDKSQELSIVSVAGPDGRTVLPVFSSVAAMAAWNPDARPVPAGGDRVIAAALHDGSGAVVLDPGTDDTEFVLLPPALWAEARGRSWIPAHRDPEVLAELVVSVEREEQVLRVALGTGDPHYRLRGPEVVVELTLVPGLDAPALDALLARLSARWSESSIIAERVDRLAVQLVAA